MKYFRNKVVIVPLDIPVDSTFNQSLAMIYSMIDIDKEKFKLVINCRYLIKKGNMFQPYPIWDDNSLYQMLKMVNTSRMNEIELYLELVQVKPQVNQSLGTYTNLLLGINDNVEELDYGFRSSSTLVALTDRC